MKSGFVAIAGRPNAGKSTLLNRVLGTELSIVTPKAQTTRERVLGILTEPKQGQIVFIDTPGIHRAREGGINAYMISEAREALLGSSVVWYLVDPRSGFDPETRVLELLQDAPCPVFILINKADLSSRIDTARAEELAGRLQKAAEERKISVAKVLWISALRGKGVEDLMAATWELLPEGPFHYDDPDQLSDRPLRFFVAEKIREQLFMQLGDELPYSCAVEIEKFDETSKPLRIEAVIHVERDSQKGMVVGAGGKKIKAIGMEARKRIEAFLDGQALFLGLKVKLLKDWSKDAATLKKLGYLLPDAEKPARKDKSNRTRR